MKKLLKKIIKKLFFWEDYTRFLVFSEPDYKLTAEDVKELMELINKPCD
ncbi:MAG: hypothetical protein HFJ45_04910 [Clostridia bacterium]|nr:hypothetical protein [Clostridia bacterium]